MRDPEARTNSDLERHLAGGSFGDPGVRVPKRCAVYFSVHIGPSLRRILQSGSGERRRWYLVGSRGEWRDGTTISTKWQERAEGWKHALLRLLAEELGTASQEGDE